MVGWRRQRAGGHGEENFLPLVVLIALLAAEGGRGAESNSAHPLRTLAFKNLRSLARSLGTETEGSRRALA